MPKVNPVRAIHYVDTLENVMGICHNGYASSSARAQTLDERLEAALTSTYFCLGMLDVFLLWLQEV